MSFHCGASQMPRWGTSLLLGELSSNCAGLETVLHECRAQHERQGGASAIELLQEDLVTVEEVCCMLRSGLRQQDFVAKGNTACKAI